MIPISPEGQILIVGIKTSNFADSWLKHRRLIFWSSDHENSSKHNRLPKRVEMVVFSKFVSHAFQSRVTALAKRAEIKFFRTVKNIGEIKRWIGESGILNEPVTKAVPSTCVESITTPVVSIPKLEATSVPQPIATVVEILAPITEPEVPERITKKEEGEVMKKKRGKVREFVISNANLATTNIKGEVDRLLALATEKGVETTRRSLEQCFYMIRRVGRTSAQESSPVQKQRKGGRRDSVKAIEEFISSSEIVAVAFREITEELSALRKENAELREKVKNFKSAIRGL